jgi:acetate---CoA ligase (ADP-forming)
MFVAESGAQTRIARIQTGIGRLLCPRSIAIVGASDKRGSLGANVFANLDAAQYGGTIHLINPNRAEIAGRGCMPSIESLPYGVDCAVLAIPKAGVLETLRACASRGVGAAIVFSAGFAENGEEGKAEQAEMKRIADEASMVVLGPNCLGVVNAVDAVPLTFIGIRPTSSKARGVSVVSQSGAMAAVLGVAFRTHGLDLTYSVSTGNEAVTGVEDYVEFLLADPHTSVIALLVEQFRRPRRFLELARRARSEGKALVLLHPGRSAAARVSAATHTGALAGNYDVMRSKVTDAGVIFLETLEELIDTTHLLLACPFIPADDGGACVLTESGAFKAITLDLCERVGLPLPPLSEQAQVSLREVLPPFIPPSNPLDVTAQGLVDPDLYRRTLPLLLADDAFSWVILTIILTDEDTVALKLPPILEAIASLDRRKPILFAGLDEGAVMNDAYRSRLRELQVPFFPTAERALRAVARVRSAGRPRTPLQYATTRASTVECLPPGTLSEFESKQILRRIEPLAFAFPDSSLVTSVERAVEAAATLTYPVVLKAQSRQLLHKTEAGGVVLNLRTAEEVKAAWDKLQNNVQRYCPGLVLEGVLVERMSSSGTEFIIGGRNDPDWGPIVLIGLGGVFAEVLQDARLLVPGLSLQEIEREIGRLKAAAVLKGFRGAAAPDVPALARIIAMVGAFIGEHPEVREIDLNPVVVHASGATILDALIVCEESSTVTQ